MAERPDSLNLIASEPEGLFRPRKVQFLCDARVGERDDFVWAHVNDSFGEDELKYKHPATPNVLLAARHHGYSIRDLNQLPLDVYICRVNDPSDELKTKLANDDVSIMAWALLLPGDDNRTDLEQIYTSLVQRRGNVYYINPVKQ